MLVSPSSDISQWRSQSKTLPGSRPGGPLHTLSCCVPAVQLKTDLQERDVPSMSICFYVSHWLYRAAVCEVPMNRWEWGFFPFIQKYGPDEQMHAGTERNGDGHSKRDVLVSFRKLQALNPWRLISMTLNSLMDQLKNTKKKIHKKHKET